MLMKLWKRKLWVELDYTESPYFYASKINPVSTYQSLRILKRF